MNNSNACANNLAQTNQVACLVELANQNSFNWAPMVKFMTVETNPCDVESRLLELYFEVAELITDNISSDVIGITRDHLWYLRQLIESVKALHSGQNSEVLFIANDNIKTITDMEKVNMLNRLVKEYEQRLIEQGKEIGRYMCRVECLQQQLAEYTSKQ